MIQEYGWTKKEKIFDKMKNIVDEANWFVIVRKYNTLPLLKLKTKYNARRKRNDK